MKVTHKVKIKVTGRYYTRIYILYKGGLSKQAAKPTVTDPESQTLVRTWGGGPRMVDVWWRT